MEQVVQQDCEFVYQDHIPGYVVRLEMGQEAEYYLKVLSVKYEMIFSRSLRFIIG
jgi:hypothetical protein